MCVCVCGIARSHGSQVLRNIHTDFNSGRTNLHSKEECFLLPPMCLPAFDVFNDRDLDRDIVESQYGFCFHWFNEWNSFFLKLTGYLYFSGLVNEGQKQKESRIKWKVWVLC